MFEIPDKEEDQIIGLMKFENGKLKKFFTSSESASDCGFMVRAVKKHSDNFKDVNNNLEYTFLYPGTREIVHLPGTTQEFVLNKYKEEVGKNLQPDQLLYHNKGAL